MRLEASITALFTQNRLTVLFLNIHVRWISENVFPQICAYLHRVISACILNLRLLSKQGIPLAIVTRVRLDMQRDTNGGSPMTIVAAWENDDLR